MQDGLCFFAFQCLHTTERHLDARDTSPLRCAGGGAARAGLTESTPTHNRTPQTQTTTQSVVTVTTTRGGSGCRCSRSTPPPARPPQLASSRALVLGCDDQHEPRWTGARREVTRPYSHYTHISVPLQAAELFWAHSAGRCRGRRRCCTDARNVRLATLPQAHHAALRSHRRALLRRLLVLRHQDKNESQVKPASINASPTPPSTNGAN